MSTPTNDPPATVAAVVRDLAHGIHGESELRLVGEFLEGCLADDTSGDDPRTVCLKALGWLEDAVDAAEAALNRAAAPGVYKVAVYFGEGDRVWHHADTYRCAAASADEAKRRALDALEDTRVEFWKAEVVGFEPAGDEDESKEG
jgi:hypothetical protein